jgi:hypothetical protein
VTLPRLIRIGALAIVLQATSAAAQVTPAVDFPPPDDTPNVRVGGTLFADYTTTLDPEITDANGNRVSPSAFNIGRAYINVLGQLNHVIAFRTRRTSLVSPEPEARSRAV